MTKKENSLDDVKKDYKNLQKKYNLPTFEKLNEEFQIEKIAEVKTDHLLREIRKAIGEKFFNYVRFTETLLNPAHSQSMFVFSMVKMIDGDKKKTLSDVYSKLSKNELKIIERDLEYSEKAEAEYIKDSYKMWNEIKEDLLKIIKHIDSNWNNKSEGKSKGYFG